MDFFLPMYSCLLIVIPFIFVDSKQVRKTVDIVDTSKKDGKVTGNLTLTLVWEGEAEASAPSSSRSGSTKLDLSRQQQHESASSLPAAAATSADATTPAATPADAAAAARPSSRRMVKSESQRSVSAASPSASPPSASATPRAPQSARGSARGSARATQTARTVAVCSVLRVVVEQASVLEKQDLIGHGDPYVVVRFNGETLKTGVVKNTRNPVWNQGSFPVDMQIFCCYNIVIGVEYLFFLFFYYFLK